MGRIELASQGVLLDGIRPGQALFWTGSEWVPRALPQMFFRWCCTSAPAVVAARFPWSQFIASQTTLAASTPEAAPVDGWLSTLSFTCTNVLADSVLCTVLFDAGATALQMTIPPSAQSFALTLDVPMPIRQGQQVGLQLNQSGTTVNATWNGRWSLV
jgi:hypothetical protein